MAVFDLTIETDLTPEQIKVALAEVDVLVLELAKWKSEKK